MKYKPIQEIRDMIDGARHALGEVPMGRALFSALDQLAQAVDALAEREQNKVNPESTDWQENAMTNEELRHLAVILTDFGDLGTALKRIAALEAGIRKNAGCYLAPSDGGWTLYDWARALLERKA